MRADLTWQPIWLLCVAGLVFAAPLTAATQLGDSGPAGTVPGCIGDCSGDRTVTVNELVLLVQTALGESAVAPCPSAPARVDIEVLVAAVRQALFGCPGGELVSFRNFRLAQEAALGFCPDAAAPISASIHATERGYVFGKALLAEGTPGVDRCLDLWVEDGVQFECPVLRWPRCHLLTAAELVRVRDTFDRVRLLSSSPDPACAVVHFDPCRIVSASWDGVYATDYLCSRERRFESETTELLLDLVGALGEGPEAVCPNSVCGDGKRDRDEACDDGNLAGGDGCASNCTFETRRAGRFDTPGSRLVLQTAGETLETTLAGSQVLVTGADPGRYVFGANLDTVGRPGEIPLVVPAADLLIEPLPLGDAGCLCLRAQPASAFGAGVTASGTIECANDAGGYVWLRVAQDHNTTPGDPANRGGLADDAECSARYGYPSGTDSRACREGGDGACTGPRHAHAGVCNSPRVVEDFLSVATEPGTALVTYRLSLAMLDAPDCVTGTRTPDGTCVIADYGPDCLPCTDDDAGMSIAADLLTTSERIGAAVYDADNNSSAATGVSTVIERAADGQRFDCAALAAEPAGQAGGVLAGALPTIDLSPLGDAVLTLVLASPRGSELAGGAAAPAR